MTKENNINISQSKQNHSRFSDENYTKSNNVVLVKSSYLNKLDEKEEEERNKSEI